MNWFKDLFIDEAKSALNSVGAPTDEQVSDAVEEYLEENPVSSATAKIENGVLKIT
jgi:hypothetical protein